MHQLDEAHGSSANCISPPTRQRIACPHGSLPLGLHALLRKQWAGASRWEGEAERVRVSRAGGRLNGAARGGDRQRHPSTHPNLFSPPHVIRLPPPRSPPLPAPSSLPLLPSSISLPFPYLTNIFTVLSLCASPSSLKPPLSQPASLRLPSQHLAPKADPPPLPPLPRRLPSH